MGPWMFAQDHVLGFDDITADALRAAGHYKWTEQGPHHHGAGAAEMDFGTAPAVTEALHDAVDRNLLGYLTPAAALAARTACARWLSDAHAWHVSPADVQLIPDGVRALHIAIEHFSRPGSPVIVPTPAYPPFLHVPELLGRDVIEVELVRHRGRYGYDLDRLDRAFRDGGELLLLCNPHNPVGRVLDGAELTAITEVVARHGGRVFADEVHAPLVLPGRTHLPYASTSWTAAQHTITAVSASKAWNLPGLKCAQVVLSNAADRRRWEGLGRLATDGTSVLGAVAASAAYEHGQPWLRAVLDYLDHNRQNLAGLLDAFLPSVRYRPPEGTYLGWLDCRRLELADLTPAQHFARHAQVVTLDGADCGAGGSGFVRVNFATTQPILTAIVARLAESI